MLLQRHQHVCCMADHIYRHWTTSTCRYSRFICMQQQSATTCLACLCSNHFGQHQRYISKIVAPAVISALHLVSNLRLYTPRNVDETCLELSSSIMASASGARCSNPAQNSMYLPYSLRATSTDESSLCCWVGDASHTCDFTVPLHDLKEGCVPCVYR